MSVDYNIRNNFGIATGYQSLFSQSLTSHINDMNLHMRGANYQVLPDLFRHQQDWGQNYDFSSVNVQPQYGAQVQSVAMETVAQGNVGQSQSSVVETT